MIPLKWSVRVPLCHVDKLREAKLHQDDLESPSPLGKAERRARGADPEALGWMG